MKPLEGLKVIDLSWVVAGPLMTRTLADFGALVIRIESPDRVDTARVMQPFYNGEFGSENSGLYQTCNAGKFGMVIDLASDHGQEIVRDLVRWADVVVESFSPGTLAKWNLDYSRLREINPSLVMMSSSLMGQSGPHSKLAGFGNIGASISGFQAIVGEANQLPLGPYGPYTDYLAPRLGLVALLTAVLEQRSTGRGCHIDLSQVEAGVFFLSPHLAESLIGYPPLIAQGNNDVSMYPHNVFRCLDENELERFVALAVRDSSDWLSLCIAIDRSDLAQNPAFATAEGRREHPAVIDSAIASWSASRTVEEVERILVDAGIPAYRAVSAVDYTTDPHIMDRQHLVEVRDLNGRTFVVEGPRVRLIETPGSPETAAPSKGQHTRQILTEVLDYDTDRINTLITLGVVK